MPPRFKAATSCGIRPTRSSGSSQRLRDPHPVDPRFDVDLSPGGMRSTRGARMLELDVDILSYKIKKAVTLNGVSAFER